MNKDLIRNKINEYEMLIYNEIIKDINLSIKEAKEKNLNPLETYRLIQSTLEKLEQEIISMFPISNQIPLTEDILEKIDEYIDPYLNKANIFMKKEVKDILNELDNDDYMNLYDELQSTKGLNKKN